MQSRNRREARAGGARSSAPRGGRPYFSYGSNMAVEQMAVRCPRAVLLGRARLRHHEFRISRSGYATVVRKRNGVVEGLAWLLARPDERALDRYEEVANGLYRKIDRVVELEGGRRLRALIYEATQPAPGRARAGHVETIVAAALAHGFPPEAVARLSRWRRP